MDSMTNVRELILNILLEEEKGTSYGSALIRRCQDECPELTKEQRSFIKRLAEGVIGDKARLDRLITILAEGGKPVRSFHPVVRNALRMGLYEIFYMDRVPDAAAIDESDKLVSAHVGKNEKKRLTGFTNALLREAVRRKEELAEEIRTSKDPELRYSLPKWILKLWEEQYGKKRARGIAAAFEEIRPITLRIDERLSKEEKETLVRRWEEGGIEVTPSPYLPYAFQLSDASDPSKLYGFREGLFAVQDTASMLVAEAAGARGEEVIVDVCSAPGGKALHLASKLKGGKVLAFDLYEKKCEKIQANAERMHLEDRITVRKKDASVGEPFLPADVLILDLPCSGLGVLGRKREIRYRVLEKDLKGLSKLQKKIAAVSMGYVKPGTVVIYSTCTIDRLENDEVADYLEKECGLTPETLEDYMPEKLKESCYGPSKSRLQIFPDLTGMDGFFIARFRKQELN